MTSEMIDIDGSLGEGGGQVIRTALSLSAITKKPVRIFNIRAGRPNPGLQAQHLTAAKAMRNVCRGTSEHAELQSSELIFHPGEIVGGRYEFNIGTAGSVTLVAQTLLPILLFASKPSTLRIIGGTHVMKSPSYDYFERVFLPAIINFGVNATAKLLRPGFYPKGGGDMEIGVNPEKPVPCSTWKKDDPIHVLIRVSQLPVHIAVREKKVFLQNNIEDVHIWEDPPALDAGNALLVWQGLRGVYALGERGKRAEQVAEEALDEFKQESGDVDKHLADQLLLYAALAKGETRYTTSAFTDHLKTNAEIIKKFLPERKITLKENTVHVS
ncbi:MAG TPA: RNA 3'-terminal phosphate cyclase [Candidatus Bilamarchaeaceae archaeon]|nr:RNA 3'-terminal phosphate cyclase [Candidatus Bilamarchaeaceae archaeon]